MKKVLRVFFLVFAFLFLNLLSINVSSVKAEDVSLDLTNAYRGEIMNYWALVNYGNDYVGDDTITIFLDPEAINNEEIVYILIAEYDEYGTIQSTYYQRGIDSNFASRFTYKFVSDDYGKKQFTIFLLSDLYKLPFSIIDRIDINNVEKLRTIEELTRADFDIYATEYDIYARGDDVVWTSTPYKVYIDINKNRCDYKLKNVTYSYIHKDSTGTEKLITGSAIKDVESGECNRFYFMISENTTYTISVEDYFGYTKPNEGEHWQIEIVNFLDSSIQLVVDYDNRLTNNSVYLYVSVFDGRGTPYPGSMIERLYVVDPEGNETPIENIYVYEALKNGVYKIIVTTETLESMLEVNITNIDLVAPIVYMVEEIHINSSDVESEPYVFEPHNYILATDDVSPGENLETIINYYYVSNAGSCMLSNKISGDLFRYLFGVHNVCMEVEVFDEAGNNAFATTIIKVKDNTKPTISADINEIILEIGDDMPTNEELVAKFAINTGDNSKLYPEDSNRVVEVSGDLSNVNLEELGKYEVYIFATDEAGNVSDTLSLIVTVTVRKLVIEAIPKQYIVYGEEMIEILYTCNGNLCIDVDNPSESEILVADWNKLTGELYIPTGSVYAGEYNIYSTLTINSKKYEIVLSNLGVFTIKPRTFKIVASSYSIDYKDNEPNLTWYMDTSVCNPDLSTKYTSFDEINYSCTFVGGDSFNNLVSVYDIIGDRVLYTGGIAREEGNTVKYNNGVVTHYNIHVGSLSVKEVSSGGRTNYALDFYGMDGILTEREPDEWDVEYLNYYYLNSDGEYARLDSYAEWRENTYYYVDENTNMSVGNVIPGHAKFYIYPKYVEVTLESVNKIYGEDDPSPYYLDEHKGEIKEDGIGHVQYGFTCFSYKEPIKSMCLEGSERYSLTQLVEEIGMTITREDGENAKDEDGNTVKYKISGHYTNENYEVFFNEESSPEYNRNPKPAAYLTIVPRKIEMSVEGKDGDGKYNIFYEDALPTVTVRIDTSPDIAYEGLANNTYLNINNGNIISFADRLSYGDHRVKYTLNGEVVKVEIGGYEEYISGIGTYVIERDTITILNIPGEDVWKNYNVTFNDGELTVYARQIYIEVVEGLTKTYGDDDPVFTNEYINNKYGTPNNYVLEGNSHFVLRIINTLENNTIVNQENYEPFDKDKLQYFLKRSKDSSGIDPEDMHEGEMVGSYLISEEKYVNDTNYIIDIYQDYYFNITQREITIIINNAEIEYNYDNFVPKFSYSFSNLKFSDVLIGQPTVAGISNGYRNNGYYDIVVGNITQISESPEISSDSGYWLINGKETFVSLERIPVLDNSLIHIRNDKYAIWDYNTNTFIETNIAFEEYSVAMNYTVQYQAGTLDVIPREVVIIPDGGLSKIYGEFDPAFTYKVVHYSNYIDNNHILEVIKDPTDFVGDLGREIGEKPGEYRITQSTLRPAEKGVIHGRNFIIKGFDSAVIFNIEKRDYIIRHAAADENNRVEIFYGNGGLASTVQGYKVISGSLADNTKLCTDEIVDGESVCHAIFDVIGGSVATFPENAEDAGTYTIVSKDLRIERFYNGIDVTEYYNFVFVESTLVILPRVIYITPDANQSKVYGNGGGDNCDITYSFRPELVKPTDTFTGCLRREPKFNPDGVLTSEEVGNYEITMGDLVIGPNYKLVMNSSVTYQILPRTLNIIAKVSGDAVSKSGNMNVYTMMYGDDFEIGYDIGGDGLVDNPLLGIKDSLINDVELYSEIDGVATNQYHGVGTYLVLQGELAVANNKGRNYNMVFENATFVVTKKVIHIHPDALSKLYGDPDPEFTYTISGIENAPDPVGNISRMEGEKAGTYPMNLGNLSFGKDYDLVIDDVSFEIKARLVTVSIPSDVKKIYSFPDPELVFDTYVEGNFEIDVPWQNWITRTGGEEVGIYDIIQGDLTLGPNYIIDFKDNGHKFIIEYDIFRYIVINNITQNQYQTQGEESLVRLEARFNKGADETNLKDVSWSVTKDGKDYEFDTIEINNNITFTPTGSAAVYVVSASYNGISATYTVTVRPNNVSNIHISLDSSSYDVQVLGNESELIYKADIVLYNEDYSNIIIEWFIGGKRVCESNVTSPVSYCRFTPNKEVEVELGDSIVYASIGNKTFSNSLKFTLQDNAAPTIVLKGDKTVYIEVYQNGNQVPFNDPMWEAKDDIDGDISHKVKVSGDEINYWKKGSYLIVYTVEDNHGHIAANYRTVIVRDTYAPVASLVNPELSTVILEYGQAYEEYGAVGYDLYDQYWGKEIIPTITKNVNLNKIGTYEVRYLFVDSSGNFTELVRTVKIIDTTPPTITLIGSDTITLEYLETFKDDGAWFEDNYDPRVRIYASKIEFIDPDTLERREVSSVDTSVLGEYLLTYYKKDSSGNLPIPAGGVTRMVSVKDTTPPEIILLGANPFILRYGDTYVDPGYMVIDNYDGDITNDPVLVEVEAIIGDTLGDYYVTYRARDTHNNISEPVIRTVVIMDLVSPMLVFTDACPEYIYLEALRDTLDPKCNLPGTGYVVYDDYLPDIEVIQNWVTYEGGVDTTTVGTYDIIYRVSDRSGNKAREKVRHVVVRDTTKPTLTLNPKPGEEVDYYLEVFSDYVEYGWEVHDTYDDYHDIEVLVEFDHDININRLNTYTITYIATDSNGNQSNPVYRHVTVRDTVPPEVTLIGDLEVVLERGEARYVDRGATAYDNYDKELTNVKLMNEENLPDGFHRGRFEVEYCAWDSSGNVGCAKRLVIVQDTIAPEVKGVNNGEYYNRPFYIYFDPTYPNTDEVLTATLNGEVITSPWQIYKENSYHLEVVDDAGNTTTLDFVLDMTAPVILGTNDKLYINHDVNIHSDEELRTITYRYGNGGYVTENVNSMNFTNEGEYWVYATDMAGNTGKLVQFIIDKTPPEFALVGVENGGITDTNVTLITENDVVVSVNGEYISTTSTFTNNGYYKVTLRDKAGNDVFVQFVINNKKSVTISDKHVTFISQNNAINEFTAPAKADYPRGVGFIYAKPLLDGTFEYISGTLFSDEEYSQLTSGTSLTFDVPKLNDEEMAVAFIVTLDELNKFTTQTVEGDDGSTITYAIVAIIIAAFGGGAFYFFVVVKRKKEEEEVEEEIVEEDDYY